MASLRCLLCTKKNATLPKIRTFKYSWVLFSLISIRCGGVVAHCWIIVELAALEGRKKVKEEVKALISMEDIH